MTDGSKSAPTVAGFQKPGRSPCGTNTAPKRFGRHGFLCDGSRGRHHRIEQRQREPGADAAQNLPP